MSTPATFTGISIWPPFNSPSTEWILVGQEWDPRTGWNKTFEWKGRAAEIQAEEAIHRAAGRRTSKTLNDQRSEWTLRVTTNDENDSSDEPLSDEWELDGNTLEKELWDLPFVRAVFETMKDDKGGNPTGDPRLAEVPTINWVRKAVEAFVRGDDTIMNLGTSGGDGDPAEIQLTWSNLHDYAVAYGFHSDSLIRLMRLFSQGYKAFPVSQYVLRRNREIPNNSNIKPDYEDVFKIRSSQSLKDHEEIPDTIKFILPDGEWVKQTPTVRRGTGLRWVVTEEWWHADKWEREFYGEPV